MSGPYDDILNGGPGPKRPPAAKTTPAPAAPPAAGAGGDPYADIVGADSTAAPTGAPPADDGPGSLSRWWHLAKASAYGIQGQVVADAKLALDAGAALTGTPQTAVDAERLDPVIAAQKQQMRDEQSAAGPARSTLEAVGDFAASAAPYVASYVAGGELLAPEEAAAGYGARVLATTKAALPVTAAFELGDKDLSSANTIGSALGQFDHTRALGQMLERMSDSPFGRVLVGGVLDVAGNAIGEGLAEGVGRIKAARQATADAAYEAANAQTIANAHRWTPPEQKLLPAGQYDLPASSADLAGRTTQFEGPLPDQGYRMQANVPAEQDLENALRARRTAQMAADSPPAEPPAPAVPQRLLTAGAPEPKLLTAGAPEPPLLSAGPPEPKRITAGPIRLPGEIAPEEQMRRAVNMARESSGASADEAAVQAEVDRRLNAHYGENPEAAVQMSEGDQSTLRAAVERQVREGRHPGLPAGTPRYAVAAGAGAASTQTTDEKRKHALQLVAGLALGTEAVQAVRHMTPDELDHALAMLKGKIKSGEVSPARARFQLESSEDAIKGTIEERAAQVVAGLPSDVRKTISHDTAIDWLKHDSRSLADRYLTAAKGDGAKAIAMAHADGVALQRGTESHVDALIAHAKPILEEVEGRIRATADMEPPPPSRPQDVQSWWNMMRRNERQAALKNAGTRESQAVVASLGNFESLNASDRREALKAHDLYAAGLNNAPIHRGYREQLQDLGLPTHSGRFAGGAAIAGYDYKHKDDQDVSTRHKLVLGALAAMGLASIPSVRESVYHLIGRGVRQAAAHSAAGLSDPAVQRVAKAFAMEAKPAAKRSAAAIGERFYREAFDKLYSLGQYGRKTLGSDRLRAEAQRASGVIEAAHESVRLDFTPVAQAAKGIEPQVAYLAGAERALELDRIYPGVSKGISVDDAKQTISVLSKIPAIRAATDKLQGYYRTLLDRRLANDLITPDAYKAIVAKGQFYVPFVRDFLDDVKDSGSRGSKGLLQKGSGVRAMTDEAAMAQIKNPLQQAIIDTYLLEKQIARQRVTKLVVEGYDTNRTAAQDFIREVSSPSDGHTPTETVTVNGKTRHFQFVDKGFHDAWVGLAPQSADLAMQMLRGVKNLQRVGVTMAPIFTLRNAVRDFAFTAVQSSPKHALGGAIAGAATGAAVDREHPVAGAIMGAAGGALAPHTIGVLRGFATVMGHEMGKDWLDGKVYSEFLREGGSGFGYFPRKQQEVEKLLTQLQSDGKIHPADFVAPQNWWHTLEMVNHAVEQAPRFAEYRKLRAAGTAVPDAILKARDLSVDFSNTGAGQAIRTWTSATPFFNAKLQGWDKNFRVFVGERAPTGAMQWFGPKQQKAAAAAMAIITAPSVALWWQNKDDPDYWKQDYWVRNLFWLVPKGNGEFWKIPKPFEVGYAFASVPERFLDWAYQHKPEMFAGEDGKTVRVPYSLKKSMTQMGSALGLDVYNDTPGIVRPLLEAGLNKDTFTQRNIVPDRMTQLPADQQYDDRTSTLARAIGGATGSSPMQIDHLINGFTGNLGREVNAGMTQELRGAGLDDRGPAHDAPDPFTAGAATNMESQPAPVTDLLDEDKRLEGVQAGIKNIENQGRWQDLAAYYHEHGQELGEVRLTRIFAEHVRQLSDVIHKIETNTSLPDEERQRRIANLRDAQFRLSQAYASASRR